MQITFLGTGTSYGVPVLTCTCPVCTSQDPKNKRTRSSLWLRWKGTSLLIDTATEFRLQALQAGLRQVDAVLYTHCHADHVFGFDDLRVFSRLTNKHVPVYGNAPTIAELREVFAYIFRQKKRHEDRAWIETIVVEGPFQVGNVLVEPIPIFHDALPILGYRIGKLAYITDCSRIPPESLELLRDLDLLILGVVGFNPHPAHMHLDQALALVRELQPKQTYFTHISHLLEHSKVSSSLPPGIHLAYDGLTLHLHS
ncbi:MAG: MBL fold metallo-hydrolase [Limnochordia bacterium]|jgi:phosphoribosyl 1,2-cyclic phosphate phosphodiesterase|nr:MBL fold metallo-hydrolase [Limnochordia bacterium]MDI9464039.1 MBL fold metallo-hydrolase [Bacillota bacterium]NLO94592.1 MBL fold metallo-hydrolase [Bacillota bacterium]HAI51877.1 MBL fold metallo-hydrolase [Bacillota bacterium]HOB39463.1 MBL fold metallo-hydrolase [Limnochordia bacterium]